MKKLLLPLIPLIFLAGCMTAEQAAQQRMMQEQADMETCRSYGLRPGSEAFGNCRLQLDLARQQAYQSSYHYGAGYGYGPRFGSGIYYMGH